MLLPVTNVLIDTRRRGGIVVVSGSWGGGGRETGDRES